jgi:signal transduction histidine kinase
VDVDALDREPLDVDALDREPLDVVALDRDALDGEAVGRHPLDVEPVDLEPVDVESLDVEPLDGGVVAFATMGMSAPAAPRAKRLERRVGILIAVQLVVTAGLAVLAASHGSSFGRGWVVATLALAFALTGFFGMTLEFHRHRFTFTLTESVLAVGFFFAGPIGLAVAAAVGEGVNMAVQRHAPLKVAFNVSNRLAATTAAAVAFVALGHTDMHESAAWAAALAAALCFSVLDVVSTSAVLSIVEETRFHHVFVRSASTGLLATLTAAPVGLVALDLAGHGPLVPLLFTPIAAAVAFNARYAVVQRDEHLRFERLYESSARTASLVAFDDALRSVAVEARSLGTGTAAVCCAKNGAGSWRGGYAGDDGAFPAPAAVVDEAVALAARFGNAEIDASVAPALAGAAPGAKAVLVVSAQHETAGSVVLVVIRDGGAPAGAKSRITTLGAFAQSAALIVSNALLHEEREIALARQLDLNRQKSDFVAAVSHELRTPLAVMLGSVHTLERLDGRMTPEQRIQLFDMTVDQGGRLQRLIDELLLVAAAEHADVQLDLAPVDLADLFASVELETSASTNGRLVTTITGGDAIVTDAAKVERVLLNLVENAAKYAPDGPIELRATRTGEEQHLAVVDHGPGIPADERERVFERFVQLDQSSTRRQGGTGLGLHLCRQLAEVVGGRMTVTETPGGGCTFTLVVPAAVPATSPSVEGLDAFVAPPAGGDVMFGTVRSRPPDFADRRPEPAR